MGPHADLARTSTTRTKSQLPPEPAIASPARASIRVTRLHEPGKIRLVRPAQGPDQGYIPALPESPGPPDLPAISESEPESHSKRAAAGFDRPGIERHREV